MTNNTSTPEDPTTEPTCSGCGRTDADIPLTAFHEGWGLPRRYYHMSQQADRCNHCTRKTTVRASSRRLARFPATNGGFSCTVVAASKGGVQ